MNDHTPKHRATPAPPEIDAVKLGRRGLLGAVAAVSLTGGAAMAAGGRSSTADRHWVRAPRRPHHSPSPSPSPSASPSPTPSPTPAPAPAPAPSPTGSVMRGPLVGMGAPASTWDQRVAEVGAGLGARRIFADLSAGATSQLKLVEAAHRAGMLPVISYKVGNDVAGAVAGKYNAVAADAAAKLAAYGLPTAVTFWHEPRNDMTPEQYAAASQQILPAFKRGQLRVGPLLNGFLLDRRVDEFATWCPTALFQLWDWVGIDTYQLGTLDNPGTEDPGARITALSAFVKSRGYDLPLGVGEYNGMTAQAIASAGEAVLSTPKVWFGCVWNSATTDHDLVLAGDRLTAFRATLADGRAA
jgi:hypothetical protein